MLLDALVHIVVDIGCEHDAVLCPSIHRLRIYVIMLAVVLHEPSLLLERLEILYGAVIDAGVMLVDIRGEVDFGLYYMVE